jgi:hypothetical protein
MDLPFSQAEKLRSAKAVQPARRPEQARGFGNRSMDYFAWNAKVEAVDRITASAGSSNNGMGRIDAGSGG